MVGSSAMFLDLLFLELQCAAAAGHRVERSIYHHPAKLQGTKR
jgi:hypothetical protein